jgi:hypothetical protein
VSGVSSDCGAERRAEEDDELLQEIVRELEGRRARMPYCCFGSS